VPGIIARIINVLRSPQKDPLDRVKTASVCTGTLPIDAVKRNVRQQGVIQFLPVILLVLFTTTIFAVISQVQKQQQDIRIH
jgi:hypothetical protein